MKDNGRVIALGFFDGVHLGHRRLLETTVELAALHGLTPAVISFDTQPDRMVSGRSAGQITSAADRAELLSRLFGIGDMILLHFDETLMHMDWEKFVDWLCGAYRAEGLVAGYDFRFGYQGAGDADKLRTKCAELGIVCRIADKVTLDGVTVSSTRIRALLEQGDVEAANRFLGHPYSLSDTVRSGYRVGRTMGLPTVNLRYAPEVLVPRHGVYAAVAWTESGRAYPAVTNIGVRPTFGGDGHVTVESHLLGFTGDLYGERVRLDFYGFIRPEQRFPDAQALACRIGADTSAAEHILKERGAWPQSE